MNYPRTFSNLYIYPDIYPVMCLIALVASANSPLGAQMLQGHVQHNSSLAPLQTAQPRSSRIARPQATFMRGQAAADQISVAPPLTGKVDDQGGLRAGLVKPDSFTIAPPKHFDEEAEKGSREMQLAWEAWHRQLSSAIYQRWSKIARRPGKATVAITVKRNRTISARILSVNGDHEFQDSLMSSIMSLDGNVGLTFPAKSQRQVVTYEADYVAGHHVVPGYNWIKNDVERVREEY